MCIIASELVPKKIYLIYGEQSLRFIDTRLLNCLKYLREYYNKPIIINTDVMQYRGLRTPESDVYNQFSCHSFGRAADFNIQGELSDDVYDNILNNLADDLKTFGLTAIENKIYTKTWTHISVSNFDGWQIEEKNGIKILKGK